MDASGITPKVLSWLLSAAARKPKAYWQREQEGARLIAALAKRAFAEAAVPYEIREDLAPRLADALRTEPSARGALVRLLAGEEVAKSQRALARIVAEQLRDAVDWPADFSRDRYGELIAGYAPEVVNEVKASDRAAAHSDANYTRERIDEAVESLRPNLPLDPPFAEEGDDRSSSLRALRASERRFDLVGRDEMIDRAERWLEEGAGDEPRDHRIMVIHGPGGAGKTRLAGEILAKAQGRGWTAGFLRSSEESVDFPWDRLGYPDRPLAVAIDYSEARRVDLARLFRPAPVGHSGDAPLRVILLVREDKRPNETWSIRLGGGDDLGPRADRLLRDGHVEVISLVDSLSDQVDRAELWGIAAAEMGASADPPGYLAEALFERPLFVLLDAHRRAVAAASARSGPTAAPTAAQLLGSVLRHEGKYWKRAANEVGVGLSDSRMRQVAVVATLVGGGAVSTFESALGGLPWCADDDELRREVVRWWGTVYATDTDTIRGVEPDPVGEHLVVRALDGTAAPRDPFGGVLSQDQLTALVSAGSLAVRQRVLRVLTRIASSGDADGASVAQGVLGSLLGLHLAELLPRAFDPVEADFEPGGTIGEPLVATVAQAAVAADALELLKSDSTAGPPDGEGPDADRDSTRDAALQLVRHQVDRIAAQGIESGGWSIERYLEMTRWAADLDLMSGRPDRAGKRIVEVLEVAPRPSGQLAHMHLTLGQFLGSVGLLDRSEWALDWALTEFEDAAEGETALAYQAHHHLGITKMLRGDHPQAVEHLKLAEAGRARLLGPDDAGTVATSVVLADATAPIDLDRASRSLDELAERLGPEAAADAGLFVRPHGRLWVAAGRAAVLEEDWDRAAHLFDEALERLADRDDEGAAGLRCVAWRWLSEASVRRGDLDRAIDYLEQLFADRSAAEGPAGSLAVSSLVRLASAIGKTNVDKGLRRLREAREELGADPRNAAAVLRISRAETSLLADEGRFGEALGFVRRWIRDAVLDDSVRRAILESIGDPGPEPWVETSESIGVAPLAALVFDPGDSRFAALASRLGSAVTGAIDILASARVPDRLAAEIAPPLDDPIAGEARRGDPDAVSRRIDELVPDSQALVMEVIEATRAAVVEALTDPLIASSLARSKVDARTPEGDRPARRWMARTVFDVADEDQEVEDAAAILLNFYIGVRAAGGSWALDGIVSPVIWAEPGTAGLADEEEALLTEEVAAAGHLDPEVARRLAAISRARAMYRGARVLATGGRHAEAEKLLGEVVDRLHGVGQASNPFIVTVAHELAEVTAAQGKRELALSYYESVSAWEADLYGHDDERTLLSAGKLAELRAEVDVDDAVEGLRLAGGHLRDATGGDAEGIEKLLSLEVRLLADAGRREDAEHTAGEFLHHTSRRFLREHLDGVVSDPRTREREPTQVATRLCAVAAEMIDAHDPRLAALASGLMEIVGEGTMVLATAKTGSAVAEGTAEEVALTEESVAITLAAFKEAAAEVLREPEFASRFEPPIDDPIARGQALADNTAVRSWLTRTVMVGPMRRETAAAHLITFYVATRSGRPLGRSVVGAEGRIWGSPEWRDSVSAERVGFIQDLLEAGIPQAHVGKFTAAAIFCGSMDAGANLLELGRIDDSERVLEGAAEETRTPELAGEDLDFLILDRRGDIAFKRNDLSEAERRYEESLKSRLTPGDAFDANSVATLMKLGVVIAERDKDEARARLEAAIEGAAAAGQQEQAERMRVWLRDRFAT